MVACDLASAQPSSSKRCLVGQGRLSCRGGTRQELVKLPPPTNVVASEAVHVASLVICCGRDIFAIAGVLHSRCRTCRRVGD